MKEIKNDLIVINSDLYEINLESSSDQAEQEVC